MLTFLFWNTNHNAVTRHVIDLAIRHDVDFVLLAECATPPADRLQAINYKRSSYHYVPSNYERIVTLLRFSPQFTNILLDIIQCGIILEMRILRAERIITVAAVISLISGTYLIKC
jgi:hypothetical protein